MEKYHRENYIKIPESFYNNDIDMQIIEWWAQDEDPDLDLGSENENENLNTQVYIIRCFGTTKSGVSITGKITGFKPFYYVKVPSTFTKVHLFHFLNYVESFYSLKGYLEPLVKENGKHKSCLEKKKDIYGFNNSKEFLFVKLVFNNYSALNKSKYIFKKAIEIHNITKKPMKFKLYESNFEPFMRYCHIKDILMAGWVKFPKGKYTVTQDTSSTQVELSIDRKLIISMKDHQDLGNLLQASWDIEVYSHDRTFPDPKFKIKNGNGYTFPNEIFQIATTYKYANDSNILVRHLLTLKGCSHIEGENIIVEECENEKDLIKRWANTISKMDPDIFYTYNGDSFDCMYLVERSEILGLVSSSVSGNKTIKSGFLLQQLSRMSGTQAIIKKEFFSSSAYGDSEFNRVYIPGRLNYDLLIHYKRGMKKYVSYKLDYIASEILQQNKHDVSVKEIFDFYEQGNPDNIAKIGAYCIMDTELLQNLVDKQLILTNIIQLANVTFVPVGFLTTRGQTIKVFSQILRKARQMNFVVPHTNFNNDTFSISIKCKEPHLLDAIEDTNEYIQIICGSQFKGKGNISGKISEIIDDTTFIVLSDIEIEKEFFNIRYSYKRTEHQISRMVACDDQIDDTFTGATVLNPICGLFMDDNVAILDFASLYPTIMISRNLCYSTFVTDPKFLGIPNVNYETIAWDDKIEYKMRQTCQGVGKSGKSKGLVCGKQAYFENDGQFFCRIHDTMKKTRPDDEKFQKKDVSYSYTIVQPSVDEQGTIINKGVLPSLLEELYSERKSVKKLMYKAGQDNNKLLEGIYSGLEQAIKVSLNSTYGFVSRGQGNLIMKELGMLTTSVGRMLINQSKEYAENEFLDYIKKNNLITQKIEYKEDLIKDLKESDKNIILSQFKNKEQLYDVFKDFKI